MDAVEKQVTFDLAKKELEPMLLGGEVLAAAAGASLEHAIGSVGLTDKRLIFRGKDLKEKTLSIGLGKISQVRTELGGWLSNSYLIVEYSGGEVKLRLHGKDACKAFGDALTLATL